MGINTEQENISKIITFLRFPLIVMVVFIHAHFGNVIVNGKNILENNSGKIYDYLSCYWQGLAFRQSYSCRHHLKLRILEK